MRVSCNNIFPNKQVSPGVLRQVHYKMINKTFEPLREKINDAGFAPSYNSDQPGQMTTIFSECVKGNQVIAFLIRTMKTRIRLDDDQADLSLLDTLPNLLVASLRLIIETTLDEH